MLYARRARSCDALLPFSSRDYDCSDSALARRSVHSLVSLASEVESAAEADEHFLYESDDEEIKTRRRRWEETKVQIIKQQQLHRQKQQSASNSVVIAESASTVLQDRDFFPLQLSHLYHPRERSTSTPAFADHVLLGEPDNVSANKPSLVSNSTSSKSSLLSRTAATAGCSPTATTNLSQKCAHDSMNTAMGINGHGQTSYATDLDLETDAEADDEREDEEGEGEHGSTDIGMPSYLSASRSTISAKIQPPYPKLPPTFKTPATSSKYDFVKVRVHLTPPVSLQTSSTVNDATYSYVLSRFLTSRFLTATRIPSQHAVRIALDVKKRLVDRNQLTLSQQELEQELFVLMRRWGYGELYVRCYRMLSQFHQLRVPLIVLIGGTKCLGKASLATRLAERLNLPSVLKTEVVAELMKSIVCKSSDTQQEQIWLQPFDDTEAFLTEWRNECDLVRQGLDTDLQKCLKEGKSMIIEGPHITQELINCISDMVSSLSTPIPINGQPYIPPAIVIPLLITLEDEYVHRQFVGDWTDILSSDSVGIPLPLSPFPPLSTQPNICGMSIDDHGLPTLPADELFRRLRLLQDILSDTQNRPFKEKSCLSPDGSSPSLKTQTSDLGLRQRRSIIGQFIRVPLNVASLMTTLENMHVLVLERLYAAFFPQSHHKFILTSTTTANMEQLLSANADTTTQPYSLQLRNDIGSFIPTNGRTSVGLNKTNGSTLTGYASTMNGMIPPPLIPLPMRRTTDYDYISARSKSVDAQTSNPKSNLPSANTLALSPTVSFNNVSIPLTVTSAGATTLITTPSYNDRGTITTTDPPNAYSYHSAHPRMQHSVHSLPANRSMTLGLPISTGRRNRLKSEIGLDEQLVEDEIRKALEKTALRRA